MQLIPAIRTKPPTLAPWVVPRSALLERVLGSREALLVLHTAAGFGKSTLMVQCRAALEARGVSTLWLTLDRGDVDVARLLQSVAQAMAPVLDDGLTSSASLFEAIGQTQGQWVLFLDEYEHLQDGDGQKLIGELLRRLPRNARIVMATRRLPDFDRSGLNVASKVEVLDESQLRLSIEDSRSLLGAMGVRDAGETQLQQLHARAEGWPLALALLTQALAEGRPRELGVEGLVVAEGRIGQYLGEEVFCAQRPELREFLLRTSILHTLELDLCQALNPQFDAHQALSELDEARTFLVQIEGEDVKWRYHRLFADFLRAKLQHDFPALYSRLHLLAAGWYEDRGRLAPAIEHAIAGDDGPLAVEMLERGADAFLAQGRFQLLLRWFDLLGPSVIEGRPLMQATHAWCACLTQGAARGRERLTRYDLQNCDDARVQAYVKALHPMILAKEDRYDDACRAGEAAMSELPSSSPFVDGVLTNLVAHVSFVLGRPLTAARLLEVTRPLSAFDRIYREATLGLMNLWQGQQRIARARMQVAIAEASRGRGALCIDAVRSRRAAPG